MIGIAMITMNEEGAVGKVIRDIKREVPEAEIVIVDSSTDNTAEIAEDLGARVIRQFPPEGYGAAMDLALRQASGEVVVTLDCDGTYPARHIKEMARLVLEEGYDIVDGSRLRKKPKSMPWLNYIANTGFAAFASLLFLKRITDLHSGMRAYRKSLIEEYRFDTRGAALPVELLLLPLKSKKRFKAVYIDYNDRMGVSTMRPIESAYWTLRRILTVRFSKEVS